MFRKPKVEQSKEPDPDELDDYWLKYALPPRELLDVVFNLGTDHLMLVREGDLFSVHIPVKQIKSKPDRFSNALYEYQRLVRMFTQAAEYRYYLENAD
jgi:hypothetical protein